MKKKTILWILLVLLVVLITCYVIFYLTYDNKDENNGSLIQNENVAFENGEIWLFHTCKVIDDTDIEKTNPVNLDSFTYNNNKVNICYKDNNCTEMNYNIQGDTLNIQKNTEKNMIFTLSYEEHYIVLSETVENMNLKYYFIKYME